MTTQSEQALETELIQQLVSLGYAFVKIANEADLLQNLKLQLEQHNHLSLSDSEFSKVLNHLSKGNVFERAKLLRDKCDLLGDDGTIKYIEFMNLDQWCQNQFQVTQQVTQEGSYVNRYDVTILINGLPLVQIELKRRGLELKEAFNQINRYHKHSFNASHGLFQFVQIFVISNGVNTKYFANNRHQSFKQTFYWADNDNQRIDELEKFASVFLEPCHIAKMIAKYTVVSEVNKCLMVLRPYQYYATEAIIERVKNEPKKNGYIWHTTGSGKTLTSFKTSQILKTISKIYKIIFVVDRKDLDYQTIREFNSFSPNCIVDLYDEQGKRLKKLGMSTDNTPDLVNKLKDSTEDTKLIVTTLQKLNNAISNERYLKSIEHLQDKRIIFIFDECHRSQFGETHQRIKSFFTNRQLFGFTGTPILEANAAGYKTTKDLFTDCLHRYVVTDAIKDDNVLKFSVEYIGRYKQNSNTYIDIDVEDIDIKELLESEQRLSKIVNYIAANHDRKTHNREFSAIFCVSSIPTLIRYYEMFAAAKASGKHNLKIATIFSYGTNEDDEEADGINKSDETPDTHSRAKLDQFIADYNASYGSKFSTKDNQSFYNYFTDLSKRVKDHATLPRDQQVDILLVVNMFLTGFDSKTLNTLYVDKNLKYHGLIQAYSRTNRILNEVKSQGNIVVFRNLKDATDKAVELFSNKNANEVVFIEPYDVYVEKFKQAVTKLLELTPTVESVNNLTTEHEELTFIKNFRDLIRLKNVLETFADFNFADLNIDSQTFENYKSKYLDLYDKVKSNNAKEKVSILNDVDFELDLIHRDEINVDYILKLLQALAGKDQDDLAKRKKEISNILNSTPELRSKRELIEKFIAENMLNIQDSHDVPAQFDKFWNEEQMQAFNLLCINEKINSERLEHLIAQYLYTQRKPLNDEIIGLLETKPKLLERPRILESLWSKITKFIQVFHDGDI